MQPAGPLYSGFGEGRMEKEPKNLRGENSNVLDTGHALGLDKREDLLGDVLDGDDALELRLLAMAFLLVVREPRGPVLLYGRARNTRGPTSANTPSKNPYAQARGVVCPRARMVMWWGRYGRQLSLTVIRRPGDTQLTLMFGAASAARHRTR